MKYNFFVKINNHTQFLDIDMIEDFDYDYFHCETSNGHIIYNIPKAVFLMDEEFINLHMENIIETSNTKIIDYEKYLLK